MNDTRALSNYLQEAASWDADREMQIRRSARIAWRVAAAACVCVLGLVATLVVLVPLKRVEPYLIRVNSRTGAVDVVPPYRGTENFHRTIARYFLTRYVSVCERFDYTLAQSDYEQCGAFNSGPLNQALYVHWARGNPRSPLNTHRDGSTVVVRVQAVSFLGRAVGISHVVQVRFERITRQANGVAQRIGHWIATVHYRFAGTPRSAKARQWNPLGFRVTALELEREVFPGVGRASTRKGRSP